MQAISRRATLHEMIRDYDHTCTDLRRLITLLEDQQSNPQLPKNNQDLKQARLRLEKATSEMKKGQAIDHYLIL
jgi:DnaJ family protein C protein 7